MFQDAKNNVLAILILIFLIVVVANDIGKRVESVRDSGQDLALYNETVQKLPALQDTYAALINKSEELQKNITNNNQLSDLAESLNKLAEKNNVTLTIFNIAPYFEYFTMDASGTYSRIIQFIDAIKESSYPVQLSVLDITRHNKKYRAIIHAQVPELE